MTKAIDLTAAMSRTSFGAFVEFAFGTVYPGRKLEPNWHIGAVSYYLQQMVAGKRDPRLVLNQPPRSLKSFIVSVCLPAWILGHDPSLSVIVACYSDELSRKFSRECRTLMESTLFRRIFPTMRLSPRKVSETEIETTRNGGRYATSVGGTLTGRGADVLIVDDPIKAQESQSELARESVRTWFEQTALSRRNRPGRSLVIVHMQRLHAEDLSGILIEADWPRLVLPAIATDAKTYRIGKNRTHRRRFGDLLQPKWDDLKNLEQTKLQLGSAAFAAQFQQDPLPAEGNTVKASQLSRYEERLPRDRYRQVVLACDPAGKPGKGNDYTAIIIAGATKTDLHVLHVTRGHWTQMEIRTRILDLARDYQSGVHIIEDTATGVGLIQDLRSTTRLAVLGKHPTISKEDRLFAQLGVIESGQLKLPLSAPWLADFEKELLGFPSAKYDDQVDALVLILEWFRRQPPPTPLVAPIIFISPKSPFGKRYC